MRATPRVDELRVESSSLTRILRAAFEDVSHAEFAADLAGVERFALIGESGAPRDRPNAGAPREVGGQRFGDAVDEVIILGAATDIDERQDYEREPRRRRLATYGRNCRLTFEFPSLCRARRRWQLRLGLRNPRALP